MSTKIRSAAVTAPSPLVLFHALLWSGGGGCGKQKRSLESAVLQTSSSERWAARHKSSVGVVCLHAARVKAAFNPPPLVFFYRNPALWHAYGNLGHLTFSHVFSHVPLNAFRITLNSSRGHLLIRPAAGGGPVLRRAFHLAVPWFFFDCANLKTCFLFSWHRNLYKSL